MLALAALIATAGGVHGKLDYLRDDFRKNVSVFSANAYIDSRYMCRVVILWETSRAAMKSY